MSKNIEVFDSTGTQYEDAFKIFLRHTDQKIKAKAWLTEFVAKLPQRNVFVDVGAGTGVVTAGLASEFQRTVAIEPNLSLVEDLRAACPTADVRPTQVLEVSLPPNADLILCSHVLYYADRSLWVPMMNRMASWLSQNGSAIIILQNPKTDCMKMLNHFYQHRFDLAEATEEFRKGSDGEFTTQLETIPSFIRTQDAYSAYRIAEFVLNLIPATAPAPEKLVNLYVDTHFKKSDGTYEFTCHQDFVTIRRR